MRVMPPRAITGVRSSRASRRKRTGPSTRRRGGSGSGRRARAAPHPAQPAASPISPGHARSRDGSGPSGADRGCAGFRRCRPRPIRSRSAPNRQGSPCAPAPAPIRSQRAEPRQPCCIRQVVMAVDQARSPRQARQRTLQPRIISGIADQPQAGRVFCAGTSPAIERAMENAASRLETVRANIARVCKPARREPAVGHADRGQQDA
jgi:hypothetical protein